MMMSQDQLDWIRKHGVTQCPPGPEFHVCWGPRPFGRRQAPELTEQELIARRIGMRILAWRGCDLSEGRIASGKYQK
jgi:hypothetical protein